MPDRGAGAALAVGETVILLHPPPPLVGVSIRMERERQQNGSLVNGYDAHEAFVLAAAAVPSDAVLMCRITKVDPLIGTMSTTCLSCHLSTLANSDTCPRPTTDACVKGLSS